MEWINESEYLFINRWESYAYWSAFDDDPQGQKEDSLSCLFDSESYSHNGSNVFLDS